jgi:hypothetical protein
MIMNSREPSSRPDLPLDEQQIRELLPLLDQYWDALQHGEGIQSESWVKMHSAGEQELADFRLLEALYQAARAINEDSHNDGDAPGQDAADSQVDRDAAFAETDTVRRCDSSTELAVGDRIGKYEIRDIPLGDGGQATTYKAWDPDMERMVVLKVYHGATTSALRDAVVQEAQKLAKVRSPYVIQCHHVERQNGIPYLVLEYVAGEDLAKLHKRAPLSVSASLKLIAQVAEGLAAVHARGLLHRDIKPSNIIVGHDGVPKLLDFGLTKSLGDPDLGTVSGTFSYMAPEQARGDMDRVEPRTDIFSLGATLYFLLTGHAPYEGTKEQVRQAAQNGDIVSPRQRNAQVPTDVDRLCMRCLAKAPENRFESAHDLAVFLRRRPWRRRGVFAVVATLLVASLLIAAWSFFGPAPSAPLNGRLTVHQFRRYEDLTPPFVELGKLGENTNACRVNDDLKVEMVLEEPAYVYLIALNAKGQLELRFPPEATMKPQRVNRYVFPPNDNAYYRLTDGAGYHAFVLIASREPLPPFDEWALTLRDHSLGTNHRDTAAYSHNNLGDVLIDLNRWTSYKHDGVWIFDELGFHSKRTESDDERGKIVVDDAAPQPILEFCEMLRNQPGVDLVRAIGFPVRAPSDP